MRKLILYFTIPCVVFVLLSYIFFDSFKFLVPEPVKNLYRVAMQYDDLQLTFEEFDYQIKSLHHELNNLRSLEGSYTGHLFSQGIFM